MGGGAGGTGPCRINLIVFHFVGYLRMLNVSFDLECGAPPEFLCQSAT